MLKGAVGSYQAMWLQQRWEELEEEFLLSPFILSQCVIRLE